MPACSCEHGAAGVRTYIASTTANVVVLSIAAYFFASGSLLDACTAHARTHACTLYLHCYICLYVCLTASFMHSHCMSPTAIRAEGGVVQGVGHQTSQHLTSLGTLPVARVAVGQ